MEPLYPPDALYDEINRNLVKGAGELGGHEFLPEQRLETILTKSKVEATLREKGVEPASDLVDFVISRAKKIFLTLVWGGDLTVLVKLKDAKMDDDILPIDVHEPIKGEGQIVSSFNKETWTLNRAALPILSQCRPRILNGFLKDQWLFQGINLSKFGYYELAPNCPLPLLSIDSQNITRPPSAGGFGIVYPLELYDNSLRGPGQSQSQAKPRIVAVKRFRDDLSKYFHQERKSLTTINLIKEHPHLVKSIAAFERGKDRCVLFPWAYGGNLSDFWQESEGILRNTQLRASLVSWSLQQMVGIADALHALHAENGRHGDLKPENLLHFKNGDVRGHLAIADFGLAKFHVLDTYRRDGASSNWSTTLKYEPPEVDTHGDRPRSRHYDMWSVGCIFLEFAIWIVHGWDYLKDFKHPTKLEKFWEYVEEKPVVHNRVRDEISTILNHSKADSSIKDIVNLVRDRLLMIKFSETKTFADAGSDKVRATSTELWESMKRIQERANHDNAYLTGLRIAPRTGMGDNLAVQEKGHRRKDSGINLAPEEEEDSMGLKVIVRAPTVDLGQDSKARKPSTHPQTYRIEQTIDLNDRWVSSIDNNFAKTLFQRANWVPPTPPPATVNTATCVECSTIDFLSPRLEIPFDQVKLRKNLDNCSICAVVHEALSGLGWTEQHGRIVRANSEFRLGSEKGPLVLSMYADPSTATPDVEEIAQLGYPDLPKTGSPQQYELLRAWLDACDDGHPGCGGHPWKSAQAPPPPPMPTRVIDVGTGSDPVLRLVETDVPQQQQQQQQQPPQQQQKLQAKYVALSHCWGRLTDEEKFCATRENMPSLQAHIPFDRLPRNFRDAVTVTRQLGVRYLWIDSVCIIQGDEADWKAEAQRMGDVFRFAYCTLAASSAESSVVGFLGGNAETREQRPPRKAATWTTPGGSNLYLCHSIDNFHDHVEGSVLASRGWVFQERALSRRTIHFTSTQVYWECGKGVRCETLGKLHNAKAALMGDAQFPASALHYFKGGRIILFQHVYETYSQLRFTHWSDRAVALLGLESRLAAAFQTRAEFGVLQVYLRRSLLWKRARACPRLARIVPPPEEKKKKEGGGGGVVHVPSWSWMAYEGAIEYLEVPMNDTDWPPENLESPFDEGNPSLRHQSGEGGGGRDAAMQIRAIAYGMVAVDPVKWNVGVTMDAGGNSGSHQDKALKCIVVGRQKREKDAKGQKKGHLGGAEHDSDDTLSYVLIVKPLSGGPINHYQRVGVGNLLASQIQEAEKFHITLV